MMGFAGLEFTSTRGKKIPLDSDRAGLLCRDTAKVLGIAQLAGCAEGHRMRKFRAAMQARGDSALKVGGDE